MFMTDVTLSDTAAKRIENLISRDKDNRKMLRIKVTGGGCKGFKYKYDLVSSSNDDDIVISNGQANVVIDDISYQYMLGSVIDCEEHLGNSMFVINNPISKKNCGCGNSFSI
jgi:iron-sulfur cluster assembly accessory protein